MDNSMGKIVNRGSSYEMNLASKGHLLSKKRTDVEGSLEIQDQAMFSNYGEQSHEAVMEEQFLGFMKLMQRELQGSGKTGYAALDQQDKARYRDTLLNLDKNARLFVKDEESGKLRRCSAAEVKGLLDDPKKEAILVTRMGTQSYSSSKSSAYAYDESHFLAPDEQGHSSSKSKSRNEKVEYGTSNIRDWDELDFINMDAKGVPGAPVLPKSGSTITISSEWESSWHKDHQEQEGVFFKKYRDSASGGYQSSSYRAE